MIKYSINKGIDSAIELYGLKAQYVFYLATALLVDVILVFLLYLVGLSPWVCLGLGVVLGMYSVYLVFKYNTRYGAYGLMKQRARGYYPRYILSRTSLKVFIPRISKIKAP